MWALFGVSGIIVGLITAVSLSPESGVGIAMVSALVLLVTPHR